MEIELENNIPPPEEGFSKVIDKMEVGQSFILPLHKRSGVRSYFFLRGLKCRTKKINDTQARVWRLE